MSRVWMLLGATGCISQLPVLGDPCGSFPDPGLYKLTVVDPTGKTRKPLVYVPAGEGPRDLVFMLHGAGQTPDDMESVTGWDALADKEGFAVVYPAGLGLFRKIWDAAPNPFTDADDVGFLDVVAEEASQRLCGGRILAAGFSNGGSMVHTWGCDSIWPTAIMPTEGAYLVDDCPQVPKPIRIYHGTADTTAPYDGEDRDGVHVPSIEELTAIKLEQNACTSDPPIEAKNGDEVCETYDCAASLVVCTLDGWTHRYPGGENTGSGSFDATTEGWEWFSGLP